MDVRIRCNKCREESIVKKIDATVLVSLRGDVADYAFRSWCWRCQDSFVSWAFLGTAIDSHPSQVQAALEAGIQEEVWINTFGVGVAPLSDQEVDLVTRHLHELGPDWDPWKALEKILD